MTFQDTPAYSSTFQACANPVIGDIIVLKKYKSWNPIFQFLEQPIF